SYVRLTAVEARVQEGADQVDRKGGADDLRAEAEDVEVVVLDPLVCRVDVMAHGAANPIQLGDGDGSPDPRTADENPSLRVPDLEQLAELSRLVGVIDPHGVGVHAEIERLVPERVELGEPRGAQAHAAMVERDCSPNQNRYATRQGGAGTLASARS